MIFCEDKEGQLVGKTEESSDRWAEYFEEVFGAGENEVIDLNEEVYLEITEREEQQGREQITKIIKLFTNNQIMRQIC